MFNATIPAEITFQSHKGIVKLITRFMGFNTLKLFQDVIHKKKKKLLDTLHIEILIYSQELTFLFHYLLPIFP